MSIRAPVSVLLGDIPGERVAIRPNRSWDRKALLAALGSSEDDGGTRRRSEHQLEGKMSMTTTRVALVTGANQGMGRYVATSLARDGHTVFFGSRDLARGEEAAAGAGPNAHAVKLDVTDAASITSAVDSIRDISGRLDILVNNAGAAWVGSPPQDLDDARERARPSIVDLAEMRAVWDVNVFGSLAMFQAAMPLLRGSSDARVVNVTSALGSLALASDPASDVRRMFDPVYASSKAALNALTITMMDELAGSEIKVNLVSPGFARTALVGFMGTETIEDAAQEILRCVRLGPGDPGGTFTTWKATPLPW
ncbi:SDR family NAD(P)-dependent oxidoreductase [Nocardioides sp. NPDC127514]|uniref:SDR family NAD(P)-dependent oxidoreductase n=1 Tax=unclassified Nocardioides TaxID=2615069 RepID=UPI0033240733